jgi:putative heme-binding domain-containing protein
MRQRLLAALLWTAWVGAAQEHAGQQSQAEIELGLRIYGSNCTPCHGVNGDQVQRVNLRSGEFRNAVSDEELGRVIAFGLPGTAMPPHKFDSRELNGVVAYIRSMRDTGGVTVGDARRGQALFVGKGACFQCHRVRGEGSRLAPDLSEIGVRRPPDQLQQALIDPNAAMLPINRPVRVLTKDGKVIRGRRVNEDTYSVQLLDSEERLLSLTKADLREYTVLKESPMPSYRNKFTAEEIADVLAYLLSLRGI